MTLAAAWRYVMAAGDACFVVFSTRMLFEMVSLSADAQKPIYGGRMNIARMSARSRLAAISEPRARTVAFLAK